MAERKTREELEELKNIYNVFDIYSWSRYNLSKTDMYSYFLRYIKKIKEDRADSIYSYAGSLVHDLMEGFYDGTLSKEKLSEIYEEKMFEFELAGYKFDRNNEERNLSIGNKYNYCNKHYLENFIPIEGDNIKNIKLEDYLLIKVGKFLFNGYSDFEYETELDGICKKYIVDFKTSTIYKGDKINKERGQLLLYALSKVQEGWDVSDIVIGWLFTKYVSVDVPKKDGFTTREIERNEIGSKLKASVGSQLKKVVRYDDVFIDNILLELENNSNLSKDIPELLLIELGDIDKKKDGTIKVAYINKLRKLLSEYPKYSEREIELYLDELVLTNDINCIPIEVRCLYSFRDCFVEIPFVKEDLEELQDQIVQQIVKIHKLESEYKKNNDDKIFYSEIDRSNDYFFAVLSGYSPKLHKPYKEYLDSLGINKDDVEIEDDINDILLELGIDLD